MDMGEMLNLRNSYLEGIARRMTRVERRGSFVNVLDLIIFGIFLFPNMFYFVDSAAISVF